MTTPLPHDAALPHLAQALDAAAMARTLGAAITRPGLQVVHCEVERIKYRPQRNCSLSYRLQLQDTTTGQAVTQRVAARLCSAGDSARRFERASRSAPLASLAGPGVLHLGALDMVSWWWPNDAKLQAPAVLADTARLHGQVLPPLVDALSSGRGVLVDQALHIAQYVPEHRLCARVDLRWREGNQTVARSVYAKASREPDAATAHGYLRSLQASPAWQAGQLCTPQALLCQPEADLHWQQALPGQALLDLPDPPAALRRHAPALGRQLAALHATPVATARTLDADGLRQALAEVVRLLADGLPAARATLLRTEAALARGLHHLAGEPPATLHGDLHPRNILVDGDRLSLIDLDGLRRGPALLELGAWVADSLYRTRLAGPAQRPDPAAWQALLDAYASAGGRRPPPAALAWATAWQLLVQRVWRCVVNLKPGRFGIAAGLVQLAAELAEGHRLESLEAAA